MTFRHRTLLRLNQWRLACWPNHYPSFAPLSLPRKFAYFFRHLLSLARSRTAAKVKHTLGAMEAAAYEARPYAGKVWVYRAKVDDYFHRSQRALGWERVALGGVEVRDISGDHQSITDHPHVRVLAKCMNEDLGAVRKKSTETSCLPIT